MGSFMGGLQPNNYLMLRDGRGAVLSNATVKIYQARASGGWYNKDFFDTVDLTFTAGADGVANLGGSPFHSLTHGAMGSECTLIVRVEKDGTTGFWPLSLIPFHMNAWRGQNTIDLRVPMIGTNFGIAGFWPQDWIVTEKTSIDINVMLSKTAQSLTIGGSGAAQGRGSWYRHSVPLTRNATNSFIVIATQAGGARDTQTVHYVQRDMRPPEIGTDALLTPFFGCILTAGVPQRITWNGQRIYDRADLNSLTITTISVVRVSDGATMAVVVNNIASGSALQQRTWTPAMYGDPATTSYALCLDVRDTAGNASRRMFDNAAFVIIPEPLCAGLLPGMLLLRSLRLKK